MIRRYLYASAGVLAGFLAFPALASLPDIYGALAVMCLLAAIGLERGFELADRHASRKWSAQTCWQILADDGNDLDQQRLAAMRLAELGRGVRSPVKWWPWRAAVDRPVIDALVVARGEALALRDEGPVYSAERYRRIDSLICHALAEAHGAQIKAGA